MNWLFGKMDKCFFLAAFISVLFAGGCSPEAIDINGHYTAPERADTGMVVILPGIEGESGANRDIREGLYKAGLPYSLVIYKWGVPGLAGMLVNQTDVDRNRQSARGLAEYIAKYQMDHPGKPVFIIGHSAGGGIAIFTLESLARIQGAQPVQGVFLLSASISANYNLSRALKMTRLGIVNVSNSGDNLLNSGTATFGNVDGGRGDSAAAIRAFSSGLSRMKASGKKRAYLVRPISLPPRNSLSKNTPPRGYSAHHGRPQDREQIR